MNIKKVLKIGEELEKKGYRVLNSEEIIKKLTVFKEKSLRLFFTEKFEITYFVETDEFVLATTYSNNKIDTKYLTEINFLYNLVNKANLKDLKEG